MKGQARWYGGTQARKVKCCNKQGTNKTPGIQHEERVRVCSGAGVVPVFTDRSGVRHQMQRRDESLSQVLHN